MARNLMRLYELMGDTLARQYGGSDAHNKVREEGGGFHELVCLAAVILSEPVGLTREINILSE